jgi:hypothetical protein
MLPPSSHITRLHFLLLFLGLGFSLATAWPCATVGQKCCLPATMAYASSYSRSGHVRSSGSAGLIGNRLIQLTGAIVPSSVRMTWPA